MNLPRLNCLTMSQSEDFVNDVTFSSVLDDLKDMVTVVSQFDNSLQFQDAGIVTEVTVENFVYRGPSVEQKGLDVQELWDKWFYFGIVLGGLWFLMSWLKLIQGKYLFKLVGQ